MPYLCPEHWCQGGMAFFRVPGIAKCKTLLPLTRRVRRGYLDERLNGTKLFYLTLFVSLEGYRY
jgi:hypothetical protein